MNSEALALVQGLERQLDLSGTGDERQFRPWWLDEDTSLDEVDKAWPEVWGTVAAIAEHPGVVAHLSDLLWVERHGSPHLHARRAIDAYLECSKVQIEPHDRCRSLTRAHSLAKAINDTALLDAIAKRLCEEAAIAISDRDFGVALELFDHLLRHRLTPETESSTTQLLSCAWQSVSRTDHVERLGKLLIGRTSDESERKTVADRVISAFRQRAADEKEGIGKLMSLREALRVAEEFGHASHDEILNDIETLDSTAAFNAVRFEQTLSRQDVAAVCAEIVGADSLEAALVRFAGCLLITPEAVRATRDNTHVGVRHVVTSVRIGEANSIVTSTERSSPDEDPIVAAVERDVLHQVGISAQMAAFVFLVPALHQTLASYEPWTIADIQTVIETGTADAVVADALARALEHFHGHRYDEAVHVALPRVERLVRLIARTCGIATTRRPTTKVGGIRGLAEILRDLRNGAEEPILPEPLLTAAELTLVEPDSLNLRNNFLHGVSDHAKASDAALILQLGLALSLKIRFGPSDSSA